MTRIIYYIIIIHYIELTNFLVFVFSPPDYDWSAYARSQFSLPSSIPATSLAATTSAATSLATTGVTSVTSSGLPPTQIPPTQNPLLQLASLQGLQDQSKWPTAPTTDLKWHWIAPGRSLTIYLFCFWKTLELPWNLICLAVQFNTVLDISVKFSNSVENFPFSRFAFKYGIIFSSF